MVSKKPHGWFEKEPYQANLKPFSDKVTDYG